MSKQAGEEKTFRSYSAGDAANYARMRMAYSDALYQSVLSYHTANGGKLDTVVDVGCGPGIATFKLAEFFNTVIGVDPSEAMISQARSTLENAPERAKSTIRFEVSTAENIDPALIPDASVDLITAATCAHVSDPNGSPVLFAPSIERNPPQADKKSNTYSGSTCLGSGPQQLVSSDLEAQWRCGAAGLRMHIVRCF